MRLLCPGCGEGQWTIGAALETWTAPDGAAVAFVTGECQRCGSLVLLAPSDEAVEHIRARETASRARKAQMRRALAGPG